jgi:hypothetical protein
VSAVSWCHSVTRGEGVIVFNEMVEKTKTENKISNSTMNDCFDHIIEKGCTRYIYKVKVIPDSEVLEMKTCAYCKHYIDVKLLMKCIGCAKLTCQSCKKCRQ